LQIFFEYLTDLKVYIIFGCIYRCIQIQCTDQISNTNICACNAYCHLKCTQSTLKNHRVYSLLNIFQLIHIYKSVLKPICVVFVFFWSALSPSDIMCEDVFSEFVFSDL